MKMTVHYFWHLNPLSLKSRQDFFFFFFYWQSPRHHLWPHILTNIVGHHSDLTVMWVSCWLTWTTWTQNKSVRIPNCGQCIVHGQVVCLGEGCGDQRQVTSVASLFVKTAPKKSWVLTASEACHCCGNTLTAAGAQVLHQLKTQVSDCMTVYVCLIPTLVTALILTVLDRSGFDLEIIVAN